jgi:hypothetical protein
VFYLQRHIQPLQARVTKLWTYSGSNDPSRVSPKDLEKKDLDKRVRSLTTLTAKLAVPACVAVIRLKRIYNFLYSMLVYALFALCFVTLRGVFMHFSELTY